jgi:hypothetical protein
MKFQFSIARLLMATAMVALTFGLARMILDDEIANYSASVALLSLDMALIAFIPKNRTDFYRILRAAIFLICCATILAYPILDYPSSNIVVIGGFAIFTLGAVMIFYISKLIANREREESLQSGPLTLPASLPVKPIDSGSDSDHSAKEEVK